MLFIIIMIIMIEASFFHIQFTLRLRILSEIFKLIHHQVMIMIVVFFFFRTSKQTNEKSERKKSLQNEDALKTTKNH